MENNNYQQQGYYQPSYNSYDPNYSATAKEFLTKAIIACAISSLPVGSIIAIFMASKNRKALLDYLSRGGVHTIKIKVSSALSRAGKYAGIAYTVFWGFYLLYFLFIIGMVIFGITSNIFR